MSASGISSFGQLLQDPPKQQPAAVETAFSLAAEPLGAADEAGDHMSASVLRYKIHPVVILSILDHFKRRNPGAERVIGTLLGVRRRNDIFITNSFALPHRESESVQENTEYHKRMVELHAQVNAEETVLGW